jgi:hypothetical protein
MVGAVAVTEPTLDQKLAAALAEIESLRAENGRLRGLLGLDEDRTPEPPVAWEPTLFVPATPLRPAVDRRSSPDDKIGLFRSVFAGRDDVYAIRWQNDRSQKSGWSPAVVGGWANSKRPDREYEPLTDAVIERHLAGEISAGLYPLLRNDRCRVLACDFDGGSWALDALAYLDACRDAGLPAVLERSRSGDGGHVWVFFSGQVPAADARKVGAAMLRREMASRVEIDLSSYDRLFPSQDVMPKGSFGNLIALPLQGGCRKRGTTVFLDPTSLEPYDDQWAFLSAVSLASPEAVAAIAESVRPVPVGSEAVDWEQARDRHPAPPVVHATLAGMLSIERIGLPAWLIAQLKHMASLHNPKFYENERLRLSNHATPRLIRCYVEELDRLCVPRGLLDAARRVIESAGSRVELDDQRNDPPTIEVSPTITLLPHQQAAVDDVIGNDHAVLVAPTGAGKTVMACAVIAAHRVPTLILVDRTPLVEQWKSRLMEHLGFGRRQIGRVAAPAKSSGIVDIATLQAVARRADASSLFEGYGLVIVDECHHLPARSFEIAVRDARCRRWLGLTATPYRRDGLEAIITMQCGPVRHEIALADTAAAALARRLVVHDTQMKGGLGKKARAAVIDELNTDPTSTGQLLLATGSYLGEGFDSPSLDTLFLAFPLAFKGRVVQYIGRILRTTDTKTDVEVHDYLDPGPVFRKMHSKRLATYTTLGFDIPARR